MEVDKYKKQMVCWFCPQQLLFTGMNTLVSAILGTRADVRVLESFAEKQPIFRYESMTANGEFWFDYMADTGDGWESTFKMASLLAADSLSVTSGNASDNRGTFELPRGKFVILGGDEVYPCASREEYLYRLILPFEIASGGEIRDKLPYLQKDCEKRDDLARDRMSRWAKAQDERDLYAIPGNHDYYDGLTSFMRQFMQGRRIGLWNTRQKRSYFALQLPHRWWIWAVDTHLESDLDLPQVEFFKHVADEMGQGDRLIVCTAEPYWIYAHLDQNPALENNLTFLLGLPVLAEKRVKQYLALSGDVHNYMRHQKTGPECNLANEHKIVSGGGGAFLHPTHNNGVPEFTACERTLVGKEAKYVRSTFKLRSVFPDEPTSRRLTYGNLLFCWNNSTFGIVTAIIYLILGWSIASTPGNGWLSVLSVGQVAIWAGIIIGGYGFACLTESKQWFRCIIGGLGHGGAHIAAAIVSAHWIIGYFASLTIAQACTEPAQILARWGCLFLATIAGGIWGYLVGSTITGIYLIISLNVFSVHRNEAFSALRINRYKNFLRLCVQPDGSLTIFPIGVPRLDGDPILIESPVTICPDRTAEESESL